MDPATILGIINGGIQIINLAIKAAEDLKQSGEMTPEQATQFDAEMETAFASSRWQPDP